MGEPSVREVVAVKLRWVRGRRGLSQVGLAERAGLSRSQVQRIERGAADFHLSTAARIGYALDVPLAELFRPPPFHATALPRPR